MTFSKKTFENIEGEEKMLVTRIFSFPNNFFFSPGIERLGACVFCQVSVCLSVCLQIPLILPIAFDWLGIKHCGETFCLVQRTRSSIKVKYQGHISSHYYCHNLFCTFYRQRREQLRQEQLVEYSAKIPNRFSVS